MWSSHEYHALHALFDVAEVLVELVRQDKSLRQLGASGIHIYWTYSFGNDASQTMSYDDDFYLFI